MHAHSEFYPEPLTTQEAIATRGLLLCIIHNIANGNSTVSGYRNPLKINVGFLLNQAVGTSRDIHFDQPEMRLSSDFILQDFKGVVRVGRTPQGILVQAEFTASLKAECVRCLAEFHQPLQAAFKELFAFDTRFTGRIGLDPTDAAGRNKIILFMSWF